MTAKARHRAIRPPNAFKAIASPSPAQIREKLQPLQQPMTAAQADAVLAKNGVPPAKPEETWGQAIGAIWMACKRVSRKALELFGEAVIAVAAPLLTAAVDGLGVTIVVVTAYELFWPAVAMADAFLAWCSG